MSPPNSLLRSPSLVRLVPFVIFVVLTFCQDAFGGAGRYWFYLVKTLAGAWMIFAMRPWVSEMRWAASWQGVSGGLVVFMIWVGVDPCLARLGLPISYLKLFAASAQPWNPHEAFGAGSAAAWCFIAVRVLGSSLLVPPLEEVFFRSWLYRYIANPNFQAVPLGRFLWLPFMVSSVVFGLEHREWLAGIIAGFVYAGLVCWKKRLGDAITAHAITNVCLGVWVVTKGEWHFW